jgi:hypothetical protein
MLLSATYTGHILEYLLRFLLFCIGWCNNGSSDDRSRDAGVMCARCSQQYCSKVSGQHCLRAVTSTCNLVHVNFVNVFRVMAVLDPIKVTLTNFPSDKVRMNSFLRH